MSFDISIHKNGKYLQCRRCFHYWIYTGNNPYVTSCPKCKTSVLVNNNKGRNQKIKQYEPVLHEFKTECPYEHFEKCHRIFRRPSVNNDILLCVCRCHLNTNGKCCNGEETNIKEGDDKISVISKEV